MAITQLYTQDQRKKCYTCENSLTQNILVANKKRLIECRRYNEVGIMYETRLTVEGTDLFERGLIDIVENGVDTTEFAYEPTWEFEVQSEGSGSLSKYECGFDPQPVEYVQFKKYGHVQQLAVHHATCPKNFIGTVLQDLVFINDQLGDAYDENNAFSDAIMMAARRAVSTGVAMNDIIGIYGGSNVKANDYDGILAQAYYAWEGSAYFQSIEFQIEDSVLVTGSYVHLKYAGVQSTLDIFYDDSQASDPALERYQTRDEIKQRIVDWLNTEVLKENGNRYVDATWVGNSIFVTSRYAEKTINLVMFIDGNANVEDWTACTNINNINVLLHQNNMPIDERPWLVKWRRYNLDNIIQALPNDVYTATADIPMRAIKGRQALFIDPKVYKLYKHALKMRPQDATNYDLEEDYEVIWLDALEDTGLWFVTTVADNPAMRNIVHLVDAIGSEDRTMFVGPKDNTCKELAFIYETLHGVMVRDFRAFASNLLCSPFVSNLKEPQEVVKKMLPCYDKRVRERFLNPADQPKGCNLNAKFVISEEYENGALYALPDGSGGFNIYVLESGDTKPNGALPVYEVQLIDKTTGIAIGENATYKYTVTFDDGTQVIYTAKNPTIQFTNDLGGITFNVEQVVTTANCEDTYIASEDYDEQYPFTLEGTCADIDVLFEGSVYRTGTYTINNPTPASNVTVHTIAGETEVIDMSGNDSIQDFVDDINAYLKNGGYPGSATLDGTLVTITGSEEVIFQQNADFEVFANPKLVTISDGTTGYGPSDGIESIVIESLQASGGSVLNTYNELPFGESINDPTANYFFQGSLVTKLGCGFTIAETDAGALAVNAFFMNFSITA